MSSTPTIKLSILVAGILFPLQAHAQTPFPTEQPYEIIIYDAETRARVNAVPPPALYPRDISDQYDEYVLGIPVITNPKSCGQGQLEIRVKVENIKKGKGYIVADLHNHIAEDFMDPEKVVLRVRASAKKDMTSFCIPLAQPGDYAIGVYHDKNSNRKFDKGLFRIPKERFGMSTNPKFRLETPDYDEVDFTVDETGADLTIRLVKSSDILGSQK